MISQNLQITSHKTLLDITRPHAQLRRIKQTRRLEGRRRMPVSTRPRPSPSPPSHLNCSYLSFWIAKNQAGITAQFGSYYHNRAWPVRYIPSGELPTRTVPFPSRSEVNPSRFGVFHRPSVDGPSRSVDSPDGLWMAPTGPGMSPVGVG